jgi:hypothetical protein
MPSSTVREPPSALPYVRPRNPLPSSGMLFLSSRPASQERRKTRTAKERWESADAILRLHDSSRRMNELERLLVSAAQDPAERPAFARAILDAEVYVLGSLDRFTVQGLAQESTSMRLLTWSDGDGPITPFFTSEDALQRAIAARPGSDPHFLVLRARDLFGMVKDQRLVLNPHGPSGKVYLPSEVEDLLAGREPGLTTEVLQAARTVLVGAAAHIPPDLPLVLARFLTQRSVVEAAHLGWIAHPDGRQGYLMVVVAADRDAAMAGFGSVQVNELTSGHTLDVIVVPPGSKDHLLASVPAFYTRQFSPEVPAP